MDGQQDAPEGQWQFKPGDTIAPGQPAVPAPESIPAPPPQPAETPAVPPADPASPEREVAEPRTVSDGASITWTASEFIAHSKTAGWYIMLTVAAVILAAADWLLTKDLVSSIIILFAALLLGVYAAHKPRQLQYQLDDMGLTIGDKRFTYDQFQSFAIVPEGAFSSIVFMPLKRFAPFTTIYYDPADEEKIITLLADRLPMEAREHDAIDRFMRRIRY